MEYYLAIKRKELILFSTVSMNSKIIMLNEGSQMYKSMNWMPFTLSCRTNIKGQIVNQDLPGARHKGQEESV